MSIFRTLPRPDDDVRAVNNLRGVDSLLRLACQVTGMGFAVIARVTHETWTACMVHDVIGLGLRSGDQMDLKETLCREASRTRSPLAIDYRSTDPQYKDHPAATKFVIESYLSVPIVLQDGEYFGNLCAVHLKPIVVSDERTVALFITLAELISSQLSNQSSRFAVHH